MNSGLAGRSEAAVTGCLSESVIKAHAPRVKARRAVAQPWRESGCRATEPGTVDRVPAWLVAASAVRSPSVRFSTPVTARLTETSLRYTRGRSIAIPVSGFEVVPTVGAEELHVVLFVPPSFAWRHHVHVGRDRQRTAPDLVRRIEGAVAPAVS